LIEQENIATTGAAMMLMQGPPARRTGMSQLFWLQLGYDGLGMTAFDGCNLAKMANIVLVIMVNGLFGRLVWPFFLSPI
jgi:hypothetical protein